MEVLDRTWRIALLALTLWREARSESHEARVAVAQSVMNRVMRPGWWGHTIDEVLTKKWQYSSLTDPADKQLRFWPLASDALFLDCLEIAQGAMDATLPDLMPGADSYHDTSIAPPYWTAKARRCGQIDRLVFYDVDHDFEAEVIAAKEPPPCGP